MKDFRRARFQELLTGRFRNDRKALMRAANLSKGRITQLLDPDEPFGEVAARRLIEALALPADYFTPTRERPAVSDQALLVALVYDRMSRAERAALDRKIADVAGSAADEQPAPELDSLSDFAELADPEAAKKRKGQ